MTYFDLFFVFLLVSYFKVFEHMLRYQFWGFSLLVRGHLCLINPLSPKPEYLCRNSLNCSPYISSMNYGENLFKGQFIYVVGDYFVNSPNPLS